jgi:hypothetical protein
MASNPKPCPCCGSHSEIHRDSSIFVGQNYANYPGQIHGFRVECEGKCHLITCWWHAEDEAKTAWNTLYSPDTAALEARVRELEETIVLVLKGLGGGYLKDCLMVRNGETHLLSEQLQNVLDNKDDEQDAATVTVKIKTTKWK